MAYLKESKYIIFKDGSYVIFSMGESHKEIAFKFKEREPVSAGFFHQYENGQRSVTGNSHTLKLESREIDIHILSN